MLSPHTTATPEPTQAIKHATCRPHVSFDRTMSSDKPPDVFDFVDTGPQSGTTNAVTCCVLKQNIKEGCTVDLKVSTKGVRKEKLHVTQLLSNNE